MATQSARGGTRRSTGLNYRALKEILLQAFTAQKVTKLRDALKVNRTRSEVNFPKGLHFVRAPCVCMRCAGWTEVCTNSRSSSVCNTHVCVHSPSLGCSSSARGEVHHQEPQDRNTLSTPITPRCSFPTSMLYSGCQTPPHAAGHIFPLEKNPHYKTTSQQCNPREDRE